MYSGRLPSPSQRPTSLLHFILTFAIFTSFKKNTKLAFELETFCSQDEAASLFILCPNSAQNQEGQITVKAFQWWTSRFDAMYTFYDFVFCQYCGLAKIVDLKGRPYFHLIDSVLFLITGRWTSENDQKVVIQPQWMWCGGAESYQVSSPINIRWSIDPSNPSLDPCLWNSSIFILILLDLTSRLEMEVCMEVETWKWWHTVIKRDVGKYRVWNKRGRKVIKREVPSSPGHPLGPGGLGVVG